MERLLSIAATTCDQAEVYHVETDETAIAIRNGELDEITSRIHSGFSLRIIRNGLLGFAYTKNLHDRERLVRNAVASMERGMKVGFDFPGPQDGRGFDQYAAETSELRAGDLYDRTMNVVRYLKKRVTGQTDLRGAAATKRITVRNTHGLNVSQKRSAYVVNSSILYPNTEAGVSLFHGSTDPSDVPEALLERAIGLFGAGLKEVDLPTGRMTAVFLPETMYSLLWRLESASSGRSFHEKLGPLVDREGEKIFSEELTVINDPLNQDRVGARWFDDEGVPTKRLVLVGRGVFATPYVDLNYAAKLGRPPTGSGFRSEQWGGDEVTLSPIPSLAHLSIEPGSMSLDQIIQNIDRGVLVLDVLGPHSGNILNGDFSMGLNPGLYIEKGHIVGRARDAMISGNIYDTMRHVTGIEKELWFSGGGYFPSVAFADVSVTGRG